jgi:hypothetical protein
MAVGSPWEVRTTTTPIAWRTASVSSCTPWTTASARASSSRPLSTRRSPLTGQSPRGIARWSWRDPRRGAICWSRPFCEPAGGKLIPRRPPDSSRRRSTCAARVIADVRQPHDGATVVATRPYPGPFQDVRPCPRSALACENACPRTPSYPSQPPWQLGAASPALGRTTSLGREGLQAALAVWGSGVRVPSAPPS